ncbi:HNH endonuclease signature motif containing protein [Pseudomonas sp. 2023EL-01195]|uniref:HNH endonuclease signature motif containing protein n=1 Tax=Pseudomonas sp. 2023EL-01195 TaxID=3088134 RepID=UPI00296AE4D1|nr:HNH endonuclease signature motif containing protein [Pseudomonas sp. 2023EL-01195]MDW3714116.1 HNH endonuclease signature motif containing protein [Pseudomonas sp. 2023EL-01195]
MARWSSNEDELLSLVYSFSRPEELAEMFPGRTAQAIRQRARGLGIFKNADYLNKLQLEKMEACRRSGGSNVFESKPIGSIHKKGKWSRIKVAQPDVWKPLHVYTWEKLNGPVPEGMIVAAKDGNPSNVDIDNLCIRSKTEHLLKRNKHYRNLPEDLLDILFLRNEIKKTLKRKKQ